jgi:septal ring factor EnvC (AmiA/AmiB activator)
MNRWSKYLLILVVCFFSLTMFGQKKADLEKKRDELVEQIKYTNSLISATRTNQKLTQNQLKILAEQIRLRRELINTINAEMSDLNVAISENQLLIEEQKNELESLKAEYAKMVLFAYQNRNSYDKLMFIFASGVFNQAYKRLKYLQQYSSYRKRQAQIIEEKRLAYELKIDELNLRKKEKQRLLLDQTREKNRLDLDKSEQNTALGKLKKEERQLKRKLRDQEKDKEKLNKEIQRIIIAEIEAEKRKNKGVFSLSPEAKKLSDKFVQNKGKLPWPVEKGVITGYFGKQKHPILKQITIDNNGIDISTSPGAKVLSVFNGEVISIFTISGAGQSVMVSHGAYRVVYTNLQHVYVSKGDKVKVQEAIGKVLTDADKKTEAHIEIWKISNAGVNKENPQHWLLKQ